MIFCSKEGKNWIAMFYSEREVHWNFDKGTCDLWQSLKKAKCASDRSINQLKPSKIIFRHWNTKEYIIRLEICIQINSIGRKPISN